MLAQLWVLFARDIKRWLRQRYRLIFIVFVPMMWLLLFGKSFDPMAIVRIPPGINPSLRAEITYLIEEAIISVFGSLDYFSFFAVGMLSVFLLFSSVWSGLGIAFDRRLGYLTKFLVAPVAREVIYLSRVFASVVKSLVQSLAMFLIMLGLGLQMVRGIGPVEILASFGVLALLALALTSIFTAIAVRISDHELVVSIANLVNIPLMFSSNVIMPLAKLPAWLTWFAMLNPITHSTRVLRNLILGLGEPNSVTLSLTYLAVFASVALISGSLVARRLLTA